MKLDAFFASVSVNFLFLGEGERIDAINKGLSAGDAGADSSNILSKELVLFAGLDLLLPPRFLDFLDFLDFLFRLNNLFLFDFICFRVAIIIYSYKNSNIIL